MNNFEQALKDINGYKNKYIPLSLFCKMVGLKRPTIARQIKDNIIKGRFDGYRYRVHKDSAREIAIKNKVSLLGWVRQKEIMKEFNVKSQMLYHICKSRKLLNAQDYCGFVRFPPETVLMLKEIIPEYLSKDTMYRNGKLYYALTKLAHDMALKLEKNQKKAQFRKEEERIYKGLYSWCKRDLIECIYIPGKTNLYVPASIYDKLVQLIRIKDSAFLSDMSRRTIYNWINKGILTTSKSPSGSTLIRIKDLDDTLILKDQIKLMREHISDPHKMREISDIYSATWKDKVHKLQSLGGDFYRRTKIYNSSDRDKHISSLEGWDKAKIRVVRAVNKRKLVTGFCNEFSIDKERYSDSENKRWVDTLADESAKLPNEELEMQDMLSLVNSLPPEDNKMLCKLFGMSDYKAISMKQLSEEKNIPIIDLQDKIDKILVNLKEKLE